MNKYQVIYQELNAVYRRLDKEEDKEIISVVVNAIEMVNAKMIQTMRGEIENG